MVRKQTSYYNQTKKHAWLFWPCPGARFEDTSSCEATYIICLWWRRVGVMLWWSAVICIFFSFCNHFCFTCSPLCCWFPKMACVLREATALFTFSRLAVDEWYSDGCRVFQVFEKSSHSVTCPFGCCLLLWSLWKLNFWECWRETLFSVGEVISWIIQYFAKLLGSNENCCKQRIISELFILFFIKLQNAKWKNQRKN